MQQLDDMDRLHAEMEKLVNDAIDQLTRSARDERATSATPTRIERALLAYDGTPGSRLALQWASAIARGVGARVRVASVAPPASLPGYDGVGTSWWVRPAGWETAEADALRDAQETALEELARADVPTEGEIVFGAPATELARIARRERANLIVMGSNGRGPLGRLLVGSVADGVRRLAPASVLIAKGEPTPARIVVAVDGSSSSRRAAGIALRLASAWGSDVTLLHVVDPAVLAADPVAAIPPLAALATLPPHARRPRVRWTVLHGDPAGEIVAFASRHHAGLVVLGSRGLGRVRGAIAGSVSTRVAHDAEASVLVVKEAES